jgi:hypothetical protein
MSEKGCSPDNATCEGFCGHLKNEMFYNQSWQGVSTKEFIAILNDYLIWYREKRIKLSLGGLSPMEYRRSLRLIWRIPRPAFCPYRLTPTKQKNEHFNIKYLQILK